MTSLLTLLLLLAAQQPLTMDQVKAERDPERRAKAAVEFAAVAERSAEAAYAKGDLPGVAADLARMVEAVELARQSFEQTGRSPGRHPGPYKQAELKTQDILVRLNDLQRRMDAEERDSVEVPKTKVQEIHDAWFEGIMGRKR